MKIFKLVLFFLLSAVNCHALRDMPLTTKLEMRRSSSRELFEFMAHQTVLDCQKHYQWLLIFGTDDIESLEIVARFISEDRFDNVMISGGVGRLTKSLYSKIKKLYGLENLDDKENEAVMICDLITEITDRKTGYPNTQFWLETKSRNTKENAVNSTKMMDLSGNENILLVQTPLQQRRAWCTMRKTLDDMGLSTVVLDSYSGYIPEETPENLKLVDDEINVRMPIYSKKGDMYAYKVPDIFRQNH